MDIVETVAEAMAADQSSEGAFDCGDNKAGWVALARVAIEALRDTTLVYRDGGEVVHELRGAPDHIWKTLLDAALTPPLPLVGE